LFGAVFVFGIGHDLFPYRESPSPFGRGVGVRVRTECTDKVLSKTANLRAGRTLTRLPAPSPDGRGIH
jgi:hypothetical protein